MSKIKTAKKQARPAGKADKRADKKSAPKSRSVLKTAKKPAAKKPAKPAPKKIVAKKPAAKKPAPKPAPKKPAPKPSMARMAAKAPVKPQKPAPKAKEAAKAPAKAPVAAKPVAPVAAKPIAAKVAPGKPAPPARPAPPAKAPNVKPAPAAKAPPAKAPPAKAPPAKAAPVKAPPLKAPPLKAPPLKAPPPALKGKPAKPGKPEPPKGKVEPPKPLGKGKAGKPAKGQSVAPSSEEDPSSERGKGDGEPESDRMRGRFGDEDYDEYSGGEYEYEEGTSESAPDSDAPPSRVAKVELAPRSSATVAPSIPLPVKELPKLPSLEERAESIDKRLSRQPGDFRQQYAESFEMSWIFHDTGLEGIVYTYEELAIAFHGKEPTDVDSSILPIFESIKRHKQAIAYVREMVEKKRLPISVDLIKKLYVILHPDEGDVKTVKYRRDVPQHRLYFHEYATPDKIAYKLRNVVDWINSPDTKKNVSTLKMAAKAHYDLVRIYPFPKDSGKVARLFMNLLLMRAGFPPAIIHHSERQRYYDALKSSSPTAIVQMLRDSVENSLSSIEKLLDEHETRTKGFVN